jgi:hypothetical protein
LSNLTKVGIGYGSGDGAKADIGQLRKPAASKSGARTGIPRGAGLKKVHNYLDTFSSVTPPLLGR